MADETKPTDPYADPYASPAASDPVDPASYGWEPIPVGDTAAPKRPAAKPVAVAKPAAVHAEFPSAATLLFALGVALVAIVRIEALTEQLDFQQSARTSIRILLRELSFLVLAGTAVLTGALAPKLTAGAKAALVLVGIILLVIGPGTLPF